MLFRNFIIIKQISFVLFFLTLLHSCNEPGTANKKTQNDSRNTIKLDTSSIDDYVYKNELEYLKRKRVLCRQLSLYDIEDGTDNFELRIWFIPSMWDPSILYILKGKDSTWTLFHYQYYTLRATGPTNYYDAPLVDSVIMESLKPQKTSWRTYITNLQLGSLWNLKTESQIKDKSFIVIDGHRYILELSDKGKYKYLFYTDPEHFQSKDINHKTFIEFKNRLIEPVIYNGMRNP